MGSSECYAISINIGIVIIHNSVEIKTAFAAAFCPAPSTSDKFKTTLAVGHEQSIKNDALKQ